jgi:uncharacterized RDD family membrane protein YckC
MSQGPDPAQPNPQQPPPTQPYPQQPPPTQPYPQQPPPGQYPQQPRPSQPPPQSPPPQPPPPQQPYPEQQPYPGQPYPGQPPGQSYPASAPTQLNPQFNPPPWPGQPDQGQQQGQQQTQAQGLPQAPPVPAAYGYGQYGGLPVPPGMYLDQQSGLMLPQGTQLATPGRRIGALFLSIPLIIVTLVIGYIIWGLIVWARGQTPALQVLGMRCFRPETNRVAGFWWMALREIIGRFVEGILSIVTELISLIFMITRPDHKAIHDLIAGTVVLRDPDKVMARWQSPPPLR